MIGLIAEADPVGGRICGLMPPSFIRFSAAMWPMDQRATTPMLRLPGSALAAARKSLSVFAGTEGWLRKLSVQYRGMDLPGHKVICKGKVKAKRVEGGDHIVECDIWLENDKGEKTTPGSAVVILPSRAAK